MACRLVGAKPLSEPLLNIVNWTLRNIFQRNFTQNSNIFIQENTLENVVCEMAAILSRPQCVIVLHYRPFVLRIHHRQPADYPHQVPVMRKVFPWYCVILITELFICAMPSKRSCKLIVLYQWVPCAQFPVDCTIEMDNMDGRTFVRFAPGTIIYIYIYIYIYITPSINAISTSDIFSWNSNANKISE